VYSMHNMVDVIRLEVDSLYMDLIGELFYPMVDIKSFLAIKTSDCDIMF
jgi:hypothetical protein